MNRIIMAINGLIETIATTITLSLGIHIIEGDYVFHEEEKMPIPKKIKSRIKNQVARIMDNGSTNIYPNNKEHEIYIDNIIFKRYDLKCIIMKFKDRNPMGMTFLNAKIINIVLIESNNDR